MADQETTPAISSRTADDLPFDDHPELIFGLVGPIGVDLEAVTEELRDALRAVDYDSQVFRITDLMREVKVGLPLDATGYVESFKQRIAYANKVREQLGRNDALGILGPVHKQLSHNCHRSRGFAERDSQ